MIIGLVISSAFSAIVVYAQELMPGRVGMVSGLFFGLAFGMAGIGAAVFGELIDLTSIDFVYRVCSVLPLIGMLAVFLPDATARGADQADKGLICRRRGVSLAIRREGGKKWLIVASTTSSVDADAEAPGDQFLFDRQQRLGGGGAKLLAQFGRMCEVGHLALLFLVMCSMRMSARRAAGERR